MSWDRWAPEEHKAFMALADVLLPGNGRLPAASEAGSAQCMSLALELRSDLETAVRALVARVVNGSPAAEVVNSIEGTGDLDDLMNVASGAYCMTPTVWASVGYVGQEAREVHDETAEYLDDLMPIFERGPMYRETPK